MHDRIGHRSLGRWLRGAIDCSLIWSSSDSNFMIWGDDLLHPPEGRLLNLGLHGIRILRSIAAGQRGEGSGSSAV